MSKAHRVTNYTRRISTILFLLTLFRNSCLRYIIIKWVSDENESFRWKRSSVLKCFYTMILYTSGRRSKQCLRRAQFRFDIWIFTGDRLNFTAQIIPCRPNENSFSSAGVKNIWSRMNGRTNGVYFNPDLYSGIIFRINCLLMLSQESKLLHRSPFLLLSPSKSYQNTLVLPLFLYQSSCEIIICQRSILRWNNDNFLLKFFIKKNLILNKFNQPILFSFSIIRVMTEKIWKI